MSDNSFKVKKGSINLKPLASAPSNPVVGDLYVDSGDNQLYQYNGSGWKIIPDVDSTNTLTNKSINSVTNTITNLDNDTIASDAAIEVSKLDALTASRALVSSVSGVIEVSDVTATEIGYLDGVTSSIQTQIDTKATSVALDAHINDTTGAHAGTAISFDNTDSGLTAIDVQEAIDEVEARVEVNEGDISQNTSDIGQNASDLSDHISDSTGAHAGSAISNTPSGNLAATDVQGALNELQTDVDGVASDLSDHETATPGAHAASAISNATSGNLTSTDVQSSLEELQTDINGRASATALSDHISDSTDAHAGSAITNTPSGNLAATNMQSAVNELQSDVDTRALDADLDTHIDGYNVHGITNASTATSGQVLTSNGDDTSSYADPSAAPSNSYEISNLGIAASVSASALTIALKQADGSSDATTGNPVKVGFRTATIGSGAYTQREITSSLSMTVSSGSTLGTKSATAHYIYLYAIDNAGAVELAVTMTQVDEGVLQTTVAEGGAGAADLNRNLYSTTARTDVPVRLIARLKSTQTTAGTWAAVPTAITPIPFAAEVIEANLSLTTTMSYVDTSATILWDTVLKDTHNMYSAGTVTAPRAGTMTISGMVVFVSVADATTASIRVGGTHSRRLAAYAVSSSYRHVPFVFSLEAAKGDTFSLDVEGDASFGVFGDNRTTALFKLT